MTLLAILEPLTELLARQAQKSSLPQLDLPESAHFSYRKDKRQLASQVFRPWMDEAIVER